MYKKISLTVFVISIALLILLLCITLMTEFGDDLGTYGSTVLAILGCIFGFVALSSLVSWIICKIWNK